MGDKVPLIKKHNFKPYAGKGGIGRAIVHGLPVIVGAAIKNPGFFRNFVYANPSFAGPSIHTALNMALRKRVPTRAGYRRRKRRSYRRSYRKRCYNIRKRYRRERAKIFTRVYQDYDGSSGTTPSGMTTTLSTKGGVMKIIPSSRYFNIPYDYKDYTHYKILKIMIKLIPEEPAPFTASEVAQNPFR